jgi:hypothetical protein
MGRTLASVSAAALAGGIANVAIGIAVDRARSGRAAPAAPPLVVEPTGGVHAAAALSSDAIYRARRGVR